jgi:hypothetical protein
VRGPAAAHRSPRQEKHMREQTPIEADLDNMETLENLKTDEHILSSLLYHYFDLRLERYDGTRGFAPGQALNDTLDWARSIQVLRAG